MKSTPPLIRFGTDGWRAVIAQDFTFDGVRTVTNAVAAWLNADRRQGKTPLVVIGYDTRFLSRQFARAAADEFARHGCRVIVSKSFLSTPAVSVNTLALGAQAGIVFSASHNPAEFNGYKIKTSQGASAPEEITRAIESNIRENRTAPLKTGTLEEKDLVHAYWGKLKSSVDMKAIKKARFAIVADPMHGAAVGYMQSVLKGTPVRVIGIHQQPDPLFGGLHPEPIEQYLADLKRSVRENHARAGLATDGDADRIGVIDEQGRYYPPHTVFPLLLHYLCRYKKLTGKVVQSISLGYVSERIARDFNLPWEETPVGFKYIADRILREKVLIGGEESGGYGYGDYLPERDGMLNSLVIVEMLAATGKTLSALRKEVEKKYGASNFIRTDFKKPADATWTKDEFVQRLKAGAPGRIAGLKVKTIKDYDGIEFVFEDDSWLLLRPSGTEPVIRVYSESPTTAQTRKIIAWGEKTVLAL